MTKNIAGASRGFGRAIAVELGIVHTSSLFSFSLNQILSVAYISFPHLGKVVGAGSTLLLLARTTDDLEVMNLMLQTFHTFGINPVGNQGNSQRRSAWSCCRGSHQLDI